MNGIVPGIEAAITARFASFKLAWSLASNMYPRRKRYKPGAVAKGVFTRRLMFSDAGLLTGSRHFFGKDVAVPKTTQSNTSNNNVL